MTKKNLPVPTSRKSGGKKALALASFKKQEYTFKTSAQAWWIINQRLPNPDRVLQKRGQSILLYRELLSDSHLLAALDSRESATLSYDWRIERGDCPVRLHNVIDKWFFSLIERKMAVEDLSRDELTANLLDVIYWGYQPAELTWDYIYGMWLPVQITPKPPEWFGWHIAEDGHPELRFLSRAHPVDGEPAPDPWTLICPRIKPSYENPYGRGVSSRCFWPIVFKRAGMEFWLNFMERFGQPWVKGTIEGNTTDTEVTQFLDDLKVLVQDAVVVVSGSKNVEVMEAKNQRTTGGGFKDLLDFMDSQVSKTILGHTLSTDAGDKGSYAASRGALTVRDDIQKRDKTMVKNIYNDIVNLIFMRNGYIETPRPKLVPYRAEVSDTELATRDEALTRSGVVFSKSYFIRAYNLQDDDIKEIKDPSALQVTNPNEPKPKNVLDMKKEKDKLAAKD